MKKFINLIKNKFTNILIDFNHDEKSFFSYLFKNKILDKKYRYTEQNLASFLFSKNNKDFFNDSNLSEKEIRYIFENSDLYAGSNPVASSMILRASNYHFNFDDLLFLINKYPKKVDHFIEYLRLTIAVNKNINHIKNVDLVKLGEKLLSLSSEYLSDDKNVYSKKEKLFLEILDIFTNIKLFNFEQLNIMYDLLPIDVKKSLKKKLTEINLNLNEKEKINSFLEKHILDNSLIINLTNLNKNKI